MEHRAEDQDLSIAERSWWPLVKEFGRRNRHVGDNIRSSGRQGGRRGGVLGSSDPEDRRGILGPSDQEDRRTSPPLLIKVSVTYVSIINLSWFGHAYWGAGLGNQHKFPRKDSAGRTFAPV